MIQIYQYDNSPIQFEVIDGQVMGNATLMAKAFGKEPNDIFKTKTWKEYEDAVVEDTGLISEDIRKSKTGQPEHGGGSWIHQELVLEFSRRLNTKFSLWCNRVIAQLLKTGTVSLNPKSTAEQLLDSALAIVEHEQRLNSLEHKVEALIQARFEATKQIEYLPICDEELPVESERTQVVRLVNSYCDQTGISQHDTWNKLYGDLYYKYRVSIKAYKKQRGEKTHLDVAERLGHCGKLKTIVSAMINDLGRMAS